MITKFLLFLLFLFDTANDLKLSVAYGLGSTKGRICGVIGLIGGKRSGALWTCGYK